MTISYVNKHLCYSTANGNDWLRDGLSTCRYALLLEASSALTKAELTLRLHLMLTHAPFWLVRESIKMSTDLPSHTLPVRASNESGAPISAITFGISGIMRNSTGESVPALFTMKGITVEGKVAAVCEIDCTASVSIFEMEDVARPSHIKSWSSLLET